MNWITAKDSFFETLSSIYDQNDFDQKSDSRKYEIAKKLKVAHFEGATTF